MVDDMGCLTLDATPTCYSCLEACDTLWCDDDRVAFCIEGFELYDVVEPIKIIDGTRVRATQLRLVKARSSNPRPRDLPHSKDALHITTSGNKWDRSTAIEHFCLAKVSWVVHGIV